MTWDASVAAAPVESWLTATIGIALLGVAVTCLLGMLVGVLRYKPEPRWPWSVLALSFGLTFVPLAMHYMDGGPTPWVGVAVLVGYGIAALGLAGFLHARLGTGVLSLLLDGLALSAAVAAIAWSLLPDLMIPGSPLSGSHGGAVTLLSLDVGLAYLLFSLAWPLRPMRQQPPALRWAALIAVLFVVHSLLLTTIALAPDPGVDQAAAGVLAAVRLGVPVLVTVTALHPSMRSLTTPPDRRWTGHIGLLKAMCLVAVLLGAAWATIAGPGMTRPSGAAALISVTVIALTVRLTRDANALAEVSQTLAHEATHDSLTALPNRLALQRHTAEEIAKARRRGEDVAVLFVDLDRFKRVNDTLGHAAGDRLLQVAARRVAAAARSGDFVARAGGDEFVIVLSGADPGSAAMAVADRIVESLSEPIDIGGARAVVSPSVGVATGADSTAGGGTRDGDAESLAPTVIRDADVAMYAAKQGGGGRVRRHDQRMRRSLDQQVEIEGQLARALAGGEIVAHYQPIVDLLSADPEGEPVVRGYEALARWVDAECEVHTPDRFLAAADQAGLLTEIDMAVLRAAVASVARWRELTGEALWVSVNVTPVHLEDAGLPARVAELLDHHQLPGEALVLEVTEQALIADVPAARHNISALSRLGVVLALDDFGTGYSGLAWLRDLPVGYLKIDRSFVQADTFIGADAHAAANAIIASVTDMAHGVGARVIGEGLETVEHERHVKAFGVDMAQGYLYGRPLPPVEVEALLRKVDHDPVERQGDTRNGRRVTGRWAGTGWTPVRVAPFHRGSAGPASR